MSQGYGTATTLLQLWGAGLASGVLGTPLGGSPALLVSAARPAQLTSLPGDALPGALPLASTASLAGPRREMLHLPLKKKVLRAFSEAES